MARVVKKLDNSFGKYRLDVAAKPVDTYVAPERTREAGDEGSEYKQLALALAGIHKPITTYLKTKQDEQHEEDIAKGQQMYTTDGDRQSYADYTATHKAHKELPKRPGIKEGYLRARASNEAQILKDKMFQAYMTGDASVTLEDGTAVNVRESDDPTVFDRWSREFLNRHVMEDMGGGDNIDPLSFSDIFLPQITDSVRQLAGQHIKNRQDDWSFKTLNETTQLMIHKLSENMSDGAFVVDGIAGSLRIADDISFLTKQLRSQGFTMEETTKGVLTAITALADRNDIKDIERLLDIAANVEIAPGVLLGTDPTSMSKLRNATDEQQRQKEQRGQLEKREREEAEEKQRDDFGKAILLESMQKNSVNAVIGKIYNEYATLPGVTPQHISALVGNANAIHNARKPERDPYAGMYAGWARTEKKAAEQNMIMTKVINQGGKYTMADLDAWGVSEEGKSPWLRSLAGDTMASAEMKAADVSYTEGVLMSLVMGNQVSKDDPNSVLLLAGMATDVMGELNKRVAADPSLASDIVARRYAITDIVTKSRKGFAARVPEITGFIEDGGMPTDSAGLDARVKQTQEQQAAETQHRVAKQQEAADRENLKRMAGAYNMGQPDELAEFMRLANYTPEMVERATGVKLKAELGEKRKRAAGSIQYGDMGGLK